MVLAKRTFSSPAECARFMKALRRMRARIRSVGFEARRLVIHYVVTVTAPTV